MLTKWRYAFIGAFAGICYILVDEVFLDHLEQAPWSLVFLHGALDFCLPVLLGIFAGLAIHFIQRQHRLIQRISLDHEESQKELLFNLLISQILHEIRNPLHSISAALDEVLKDIPVEKREIIQRNLKRLEDLKLHYSNWDSLLEKIELNQSLSIKNWYQQFFEDKLSSQIKELQIKYQELLEPLSLQIHPMLLERLLVSLFSNAFEALSHVPIHERELQFEVRTDSEAMEWGVMRIRNCGAYFPVNILESQGAKVASSSHGLGLGLLLVRKMLEIIGGRLRLFNDSAGAVVEISIRKAL